MGQLDGATRFVLRGAEIVDGTGAAGRPGDVLVDGSRIGAVGDVDATGAEVLDLDGLVLAPGFVDIHTHYDAQVLWDPALTPSSWHGVTTAVMGNCGFGLAPTRPAERETVLRTLENVEDMSFEALTAGVQWSFETFPEYLDVLERVPKQVNVGAFVGHTPVRFSVLGEEAMDRPAKDDEVARMREVVAGALRAGALGFATSRAPTHHGAGGRPVPSRVAEPEEIFEIALALRDAGHGIMQITPGPGFFLSEFGELARRTGRPLTWTALVTGVDYSALVAGHVRSGGDGDRVAAPTMLDLSREAGGEIWPQVACRPMVFQLSLATPFLMGVLPSFTPVLEAPRDGRARIYADAGWRDRARAEVDQMWAAWWAKTTVDETERHESLRGVPLAELARTRGRAPFDVMLDLALEEDLATRFRVVVANDDEEELATLLRDERAVLGLSDAGAHYGMLCDANFATHLLAEWVRERGVLTLEQAVWRLSGQPAELLGLHGRGTIRQGAVADLVAFDRDTVGTTELERVWDLPGGADRLVAHSTGIEHVWVAGEATRRGGEVVDGVYPGRCLRARPSAP